MPPEAGTPPSARWDALPFAAAIFASAFLIFLVQPMVAKRILPWFGGVPAVWTVCLAFYQTTLFAGYAYAHGVIRRVPAGAQFWLHAGVLAAALFVLPVLPTAAWTPESGGEPSRAILAMLGFHVALPFLALAATGPLVQAWFARRHPDRSPYPLYAVSNAGSLLAMLGYPFLFEPSLPLSTTEQLWSGAFVATGILVLACAQLASRSASAQAALPVEAADAAPPGAARVALWLLLSANSVVLLMGVTNELCLDVASVPFLWILPLSTYLVSFILCFRSDRPTPRAPYLVLAALPFVLPMALDVLDLGETRVFDLLDSVQGQITLLCLLLFGACMVLHGELHRLRPPPRSLTRFYLCISAGGALGGIFVGLVAPHWFDDYLEFRIGIALACALFLWARWQDSQGWLQRAAPRWRWAVAIAVVAVALRQFGLGGADDPDELLLKERTFFGVLRVHQIEPGVNEQRQLLSGTTMHGVQFPGSAQRPTSYYGVMTGIGMALVQRDASAPSTIGVVGLGIGTLAAYGRPGDRIRFYEVDPAVVRIAGDPAYFTYLADSAAGIEIVEGDARVSLAAERAQGRAPAFDLLAIDAFSSDAIPMHLLTREAFELYRDVLAPQGLLAIHVSNRRLNLPPLVARLGESVELSAVAVATGQMGPYLSAQSLWMFLARDPNRLHELVQAMDAQRAGQGLPEGSVRFGNFSAAELAATPLWTDDYSDLFGALEPISELFHPQAVR